MVDGEEEGVLRESSLIEEEEEEEIALKAVVELAIAGCAQLKIKRWCLGRRKIKRWMRRREMGLGGVL